jgi:curved DNA-binding protein CbpA
MNSMNLTDWFALLDESRRPWLEPAALKQKFLTRCGQTHPDRVHGAEAAEKADATHAFAELNAAYHGLAEPKSRLLHLVELERGAKPKDIQTIPSALADIFAEVALTCRSTDGFLTEKSQTTSPLVQVQLFERGQEWTEKLSGLQQKLNGLHEQWLGELKALDTAWVRKEAAQREELLAQLEELYRRFGYFNRWNRQIQERMVQLAI